MLKIKILIQFKNSIIKKLEIKIYVIKQILILKIIQFNNKINIAIII